MSAKKILLPLIVLFVFSGVCWSQKTTGGIRGVVTDEEGKPVPGANVNVSSSALIGSTRTTTTNELGVFRFPSLPVGTYSVEVTLEGFQKVVAESVSVNLDAVASVPMVLKLTSQQESMTILGETPVLDVTDSGVSTSYSKEILEDTPTQRNFYNLMQMAPGVSASTSDNQTDRTIAFGSNMQSNSWNVDGLEMTAPETGSTWLYQNPESIEEIQVLGVGAPAEYGNHTGAVFNVVTKKGGNDFHGGATYFWQDQGLVGENVIQNLDTTNGADTACLPGQACEHFNLKRFYDASAQLGGPVVKDKAWFYGSVQFLRNASTDPGVPPDIATEITSDRYDVKGSGLLGQKNEVSGFYQYEKSASPDSASPYVAPSAVYEEDATNDAWGGGINSTLSDNALLEIHYAGWKTHDLQQSPTGDSAPRFTEFSPPGGGPPSVHWWKLLSFRLQDGQESSERQDDLLRRKFPEESDTSSDLALSGLAAASLPKGPLMERMVFI